MLTALDTRRFQRIITVLVVLPLLVMLLLIGGLLAQTQAILNATGWVDHTDIVIGQAHQVQSLFVDMETGVRGYLLTGDAVFLEPYTRARSASDTAIDALAQLIQDNRAQEHQLQLIRVSALTWHTNAKELLALRERYSHRCSRTAYSR